MTFYYKWHSIINDLFGESGLEDLPLGCCDTLAKYFTNKSIHNRSDLDFTWAVSKGVIRTPAYRNWLNGVFCSTILTIRNCYPIWLLQAAVDGRVQERIPFWERNGEEVSGGLPLLKDDIFLSSINKTTPSHPVHTVMLDIINKGVFLENLQG